MQALELFRVAAKLVVDKGDFDKDMQEADKNGKSFAENLSGYMEKAKNVITGIMGALAIKEVVSGIWNLAKETAAAGDRIDKTSQALGFSRKAFQEWDYILAQNGASIDSLGASMRTLQAAISANSGETAAALSQLGLSAAHLQSISPEEQFEEIVRALQKLPDGAKKSQLAMQLLGRNAQSLMPLLNSSAEATEELRRRAHDLGLVMSDDDVDASVAFGDALDDLNKTWTGIKQKFGVQILPFLTKGLQTAANSLGKISNAVRNAFKTGDWSGVFKAVVNKLKSILRLDQIRWPTWDDVRSAATIAWEKIKNGLASVFKFVFGETADGGIKWPTWDDVKAAATSAWNGIKAEAKEVFKFVFGETEDGGIKWPTSTEIWNKIKGGLKALWNDIRTFAKYTLTFVFGEDENGGINWANAGVIWGKIKEGFISLWDKIKGFAKNYLILKFGADEKGGISWPDANVLWVKIKKSFQTLWDGIKENAKTILKFVFGEDEDGGIKWPSGYTIWNKAKEGLKTLWSAVQSMAKYVLTLAFGENEDGGIKWPSASTLWNKIKDGLGKLWDGIKNFAKGTLKFIFGEAEDGGIRWKSSAVIWSKIKSGLSTLWSNINGFAKNTLKLVFGEDDEGGIKWPTASQIWNKIKGGLETLWSGIQENAKSILKLAFGEDENGGIKWPKEISDFLNTAQSVFSWIEEHSQSIIQTVTDVGQAVGTAIVSAKVIEFISALGSSSKIGLAIALLVTLVNAIKSTDWNGVNDGAGTLQEFFSNIGSNVDTLNLLKGAMEGVAAGIIAATVAAHPYISALAAIVALLTYIRGEGGPENLMTKNLFGGFSKEDLGVLQDYIDAYNEYNNSVNKLQEMYLNGQEGTEEYKALEKTLDELDKRRLETYEKLKQKKTEDGKDLLSAYMTWYHEQVGSESGVLFDVPIELTMDDEKLQKGVKGLDLSATVALYPDTSPLANFIGGGDGYHAKGLNYVPYDGYKAILHRGEMVLNQDKSRAYRENNGFNAQELYSAVASAVEAAVANIQINMDGKQVGNAVTDQVSRNIYRAQYGRRFTFA